MLMMSATRHPISSSWRLLACPLTLLPWASSHIIPFWQALHESERRQAIRSGGLENPYAVEKAQADEAQLAALRAGPPPAQRPSCAMAAPPLPAPPPPSGDDGPGGTARARMSSSESQAAAAAGAGTGALFGGQQLPPGAPLNSQRPESLNA
jgi:hypothetical protein